MQERTIQKTIRIAQTFEGQGGDLVRARGLPITFPTGSPAEKDNDLGQERSLPCSFPTLSYPSLSFLHSFRVENPCSVHPIAEDKVREPWSDNDLRFFPCSSPSLYHSSLLSPLLLPSLCFFNHGIYPPTHTADEVFSFVFCNSPDNHRQKKGGSTPLFSGNHIRESFFWFCLNFRHPYNCHKYFLPFLWFPLLNIPFTFLNDNISRWFL